MNPRDAGPLAEEYVAHAIVSLATVRVMQGQAAELPRHREAGNSD